jgi:hypothetical protein
VSQLTADKSRRYKIDPVDFDERPVDAGAVLYMGSAAGTNPATGLCRQLVAGDAFAGMVDGQADNRPWPASRTAAAVGVTMVGGAAAAIDVDLRVEGVLVLDAADLAGFAGPVNVLAAVYASDGDTFTLTAAGNSKVGAIRNVLTVDGGKVAVEVTFLAVGC